MAGSLNQTLYHLVIEQKGLARLASSSLRLRGVGLIHCHLIISKTCWIPRLTTTLVNFLRVTLLLICLHRHPKHLHLWRPTTDGSKAIHLSLNHKRSQNLHQKTLIGARSLPLTTIHHLEHPYPLLPLHHHIFQSSAPLLPLHVFLHIHLNIININNINIII